MTEQIEQQICIKFCVKLEHFSTETIQMIQKATAMGNWWLAAPSGQHTCSWSCLVQFFCDLIITQVTQAPYSPELAPCEFWHFLKLKSPLKGERFQAVHEIQENRTGQLMVIGRIVWGPRGLNLKGTEMSLSCVQCFLYLVSSSIHASIFNSMWLDTFRT